MTFTHEVGHILCGWSCGGRLTSWELRPWRFPYSLFEPNPCPLTTLWGGPVLGVLIPFTLALAVRTRWSWFIAHFCLLANGVYLAAAWVSGDRFLDTPQLLQHGAPPAVIAAYCLLAITIGYRGFRRQCLSIVSPGRGHASG
jgi:hypothetical protein